MVSVQHVSRAQRCSRQFLVKLLALIAALSVCPLILLDDSVVSAQGVRPPSPEHLEYYWGRPMRRTIAMLLEEYQPHLTSRQQRIVDTIDIDVSLNLEALPFAMYHLGERKILIGVNIIGLVEPIHDAIILTHHLGTSLDRVSDYVKHIARVGQKAYFDNRQGRAPDPHVPFEHFAHLPEAGVIQIRQTQIYNNMMVGMKIDTISYVLAHEIGHHVLGHIDGTSTVPTVREREKQADTFAYVLSAKAGFPLVSSAPSLAVIAEMERLAGIGYGDNTHPPPECRMFWMLESSLAALEADAGFQSYLDQHPGERQAMESVLRQFEAFTPEAKAECGT